MLWFLLSFRCIEPLALRLMSLFLVYMSSSLTLIREELPITSATRKTFSSHLFSVGNNGLKSAGVICEGSVRPFIVEEFRMSFILKYSLLIEYDAHMVSSRRVEWGISRQKLAKVAP